MNGKTCSFLFFFHCNFLLVASLRVDSSKVSMWELIEVEDRGNFNDRITMMNATLFKTVKRYYCSINTTAEPYLLVYGTNAWRFPLQDVQLTLSYPTDQTRSYDQQSYLITSLEVILYMDGDRSKGFISSGGVLEDSIDLNFLLSDITALAYQFRLYGVPKATYLPVQSAMLRLC